jgi:predicted nucleic acid-binding protein
MLAEVTERHNLDPRHAIRYLKDNPEEIKEFSAARSAIETIGQIENLKIVGLGENLMGLSLEFSRKYGLLSNDALHLATMKQDGIVTLASNDRDFERVEWVKLWRP